MAAKKTKTEKPEETVIAIKGFDKDLKCRGFQYEIGKTYEHKGDVEACQSGFHACEMPFDVFRYYPPSTSRYAEVTQSGKLARHDGDSKIASAVITVNAELQIGEIVKRAVAWILERATGNTATGDSGHAAATGYSGHAAATGNYGHAAATGNYGHAAATGNYGHAAATGYSGHAAATGDSGHAAATGDSGHAAATGNYGHAAATGNSGHAAATGSSGHAAATGDCGCAFAGFDGHAKAGATGALAIAWYDKKAKRARIVSGNVGEDRIKADTFYEVKNGKLVECA